MRCKCGEEIERPETPDELLDHDIKKMLTEPGVHKVWFDFSKRFCPQKKDGTQPWKMKGWKLMCAIEKWAKKYPKDVRITGCDDSHYMGSDIVLIEHRVPGSWRKARYHGTTMIFVPQNGEEPAHVFLYPGHTKLLIEALTSIRKEAQPLQAAESRHGRWMRERTEKADKVFLRKREREAKRGKSRDGQGQDRVPDRKDGKAVLRHRSAKQRAGRSKGAG
jgi:hypothetical protein